MQDSTVSDQIKELLEKGRNSTEVIALGYRPGTVYKAQRDLRRVIEKTEESDETQVAVPESTKEAEMEENGPGITDAEQFDHENEAEGSAEETSPERAEFEKREWIASLRSGLEEDRLNGVIDRLKTANRDLKEENGGLEEQLASRTRELNAQLRNSRNRAEVAATSAWQWKKRFEDEKQAREELQRKLASGILITR